MGVRGLSGPSQLPHETGYDECSSRQCPPCCLGVGLFMSIWSTRKVQTEETNILVTSKASVIVFSLPFSHYLLVGARGPHIPSSPRPANSLILIWCQNSGNWGNVRRRPQKGGDRYLSIAPQPTRGISQAGPGRAGNRLALWYLRPVLSPVGIRAS